jgi:hypothetical protein
MKKLILASLASVLTGGLYFGFRALDGMAVSYLTGPRRVVNEGFWGEKVPSDGPVPGTAELGFMRPSEDPPGLRIERPGETAQELGLASGDVVTEVDGKTFGSARELMGHLSQNYTAGDAVSITVVTLGEAPRTAKMNLRALVRHPGDLGLPYEDVEIPSDSGNLLRGWFVPPPDRSDGRVGIFVHGVYSSRFQALERGGKFWYPRGYGLLMMDLSGHGSSGGDYVTYTIDERKDVAAMLRWARHHPGIDPGRVVVFGTSNGAAAAIYAAAADDELPALVVDAPYGNLWDAAGSMLSSRGGKGILRYPLFLAVRWRTGMDLRDVRPAGVIADIKAPVLFVHGDADRRVPLAHSESMHAARQQAGLPSELWVLPGGKHGFDDYPPEGIFWNRILDFFDRSLGGPPTEWDLSS